MSTKVARARDTVEVAVRARLTIQSGADPTGVLAAARVRLAAHIASLRPGDAVRYSQVLRVLTELPGVTDVQDLRLRRAPSRFGEVVFGPPVMYANNDRIAQIEAPSGGNLELAANEVAVFAAGSTLTSLEVQAP